MANDITPIRILTTDTELRRVVDQINTAFKSIQQGNTAITQNVTNINTYLTSDDDITTINNFYGTYSGTPDAIVNKCTIALVNGDYDLTYTEDGEITTDG